MTVLIRIANFAASLRRERRGVAAAEFALIASAMLTLLLGLYDIGDAVQQQLALEVALRAGAQYAVSWPDQTSGIETAISSALPTSWTNVSVSASAPACYCWNSGSGETAVACTTSCGSGSTKRSYVTLSATNHEATFLLSALAANSLSYVVRFQ